MVSFDFRTLAGDATDDGVVNFDHLLSLASSYGTPGRTFSQCDFNYNGKVDFDDLVLLAANYNRTLSVPSVLARLTFAPPSSPSVAGDGVAGDEEDDDDRLPVLA